MVIQSLSLSMGLEQFAQLFACDEKMKKIMSGPSARIEI